MDPEPRGDVMLRCMLVLVPLTLGLLSTLVVAADGPAPADKAIKKDAAPKSRSFLFTYRATVTDLPAGKDARIWLPVPASTADQDVQTISKQLPAEGHIS